MAQIAQQLPGTAARVAELFGKIRIEGLYGPEGSKLYHRFTLRDTAEIEELLRLADGRPGPVLELACGTGRITIPFLQRGFEVVGLDNSPSMLALLAERLAEPDHASLGERLTTLAGDMTDFDLGRRFDTVVLGATAVWNLDEQQRGALFRRVRDHLTDDGRFLMTVLTYAGLEERTTPIETLSLFTTHDGIAPALCTFIDYAEPNGIRSTNILCQRVEDGGVSDTVMYSAWTYLATPSALAAELEHAGLHVTAEHEVTGRHQITKNSDPAGRRRLLFEVGVKQAGIRSGNSDHHTA